MRIGLAITLCAALTAIGAGASNTIRIGGQQVTITSPTDTAPLAAPQATGPLIVAVDPPIAGAGEPIVITWQLRDATTATYTSARAVEIPNCHVIEVKQLPANAIAQVIVFSKVAGTIVVPPRDFFDSVGNSVTAPAATIELLTTGTPPDLPRGRDVTLRIERANETMTSVNLIATVEGMANLFEAAPPRFAQSREWKVVDRDPAAAIANSAGRVLIRRTWTLSWPRDSARATTVPAVEFDYFDLAQRQRVTLKQAGFVISPASGAAAPAAKKEAGAPLRFRIPDIDMRFIGTLGMTGVFLFLIAAVVSAVRKRESPERAAVRFLAVSSNPDLLLQELERQLGSRPPLVRVEMEKPAAALRELLFARGDKQERISVADREIENAAVAVFRAGRPS